MGIKKVLFLIPTFPVLSETFIEREVCELYKRGNIDLKIISLKKGNTGLSCGEIDNVTSYLKISPIDIVLGLVTFTVKNPLGLLQTRIISTKNKAKSFFGNLYFWAKSLGYAYKVSKFTPDLIHAHFFSDSSTLGLYIAILLKTQFSVSGHARDVFGGNGFPELVGEKINYAKFVTLCNKKAYEYCLKLSFPGDAAKVHLIFHGLDITGIPAMADKTAAPKIYFLGRFVEKKGLVYLLQAAKKLKDQGENFVLTLAGYGPLYDSLRNTAFDLGLKDVVNFPNNGKGVDNKAAFLQMQRSDIFVAPSVDLDTGDSDGIPNNILEAGLCSKPVVVTNAGSISEIIVNGENGVIVPQKDAESLAIAIKELIHNEELCKKLGKNLNELTKQKFDIKQNIIELERLLIE